MAEPILMVALSPTMNEGSIVQWIAKEGQAVKTGDALCEVETDKASMTYESPASGTLLKIIVEAGASAAVGELIAVVGKPGESWEEVAAKAKASAPAKAAEAAAAPAAPAAAVAPAAPSPAVAPVAPAAAPAAPVAASASAAAPQLAPGVPRSSPLARKLAKARGIDLRSVRGSGPNGRIVARDIEAYSPGAAAPAAFAPGVPAGLERALVAAEAFKAGAGAAAKAKGLRADRVPLSKMRSVIATRLHQSYSEAPHYFVRMAIEMDRFFAVRKQVNEGRAGKLSLNAFLLKMVAAALERHPEINVSWQGDAIQYLPHADLGVAVALDNGLITPVVRACELKGVEAIDAELGALIRKAREGGLTPEEYTGASFTISNLGNFGVEEFTAIINPPGCAILALGAVADEAVARNGEVVVRKMLHATLSSDHRAIDGATAAAFMADFKALCEEPARALL